jgi:hypothetical protein
MRRPGGSRAVYSIYVDGVTRKLLLHISAREVRELRADNLDTQ